MPIATNEQTGETVFLAEDGAWKPAQTAVNPQTKQMLAFDGKQWTPVPGKSKGVLGYIDDAVRSIANGVTFGYADELAAKGNALLGSGTYEQNVAKERARNEQIPAAIAIPGEIAGAVGATVAAAPIAAVAGATRLGAAASRLPQFAKFGALGAAEGALAGSGNAVEGERLGGAATGAAIGAPVGAVAPSVVRGVSNLAGGVRNAFSPQSNVAADLSRALVRDNDTPQALAQRAAALNAERPGVATLADAGGENVKGLVERVAQTPGAGRTQVVPALTARQQGQANRIAADLKSLTGTHKTAVQAIDETMRARKAAADPLYEKAYAVDVSQDQAAVDAFLNEIGTGWGRAIINSKELKKTLQTEYGIKDPSAAHLMPIIDAWKRTADDIIRDDPGSNKSRVLRGMLERVIPLVDNVNPDYAAARNAWAGPSKYLESVENGRAILSKNVSKEEYTARFKTLSAADQEAERIGAVSAIVSRMGGDPAKLADMTKYLRSQEVRGKIAAIMPDQAAADKWAKRLDFEVGTSELTGRSLGNSATARRLAERQDAENLASDLVMDALTGSPQSFIRKVLGAGPKWLRDTMRSRADAMLADTLTSPTPKQPLQITVNRAQAAGRPVKGTTNAGATVAGTEFINSP
jgi:hypothetical protein